MTQGDGFDIRGPVCGIVALAFATGADFNDVWNWFKAENNRRGNWRGRTNHEQYEACAKHFGRTLESMRETGMTLQKFVEFCTAPSGKYLVRVSGHALYVEGGMVVDQCQCETAKEHPSARRRVKNAWRIK